MHLALAAVTTGVGVSTPDASANRRRKPRLAGQRIPVAHVVDGRQYVVERTDRRQRLVVERDAANSGSAPPASPPRRSASWPSPTASWPAPAAIPSPRSAAPRASRPSPRPPSACWSRKRGGWRGRWHAQNWWRSMERYVFPRVGRRPVSEVNTADVLEVLTPIWYVKAATGREVRQRIRSVLEWAVAMDLRNDNPLRPTG